jgi:hypothetical protein
MPFAVGSKGKREIELALGCLTAIDVYEIREYRLPRLYRSGVRYRREVCLVPAVRETCERFLSARKLLQERFGDCDDLSAYRAAELRLTGEQATAVCVASPTGWHCIVRRADGTYEDPSLRLGMK